MECNFKRKKHKKNLHQMIIKISLLHQETFSRHLIENFLMGIKDCSNDDEEFHDDINYWYEKLYQKYQDLIQKK